MVVTVDQLVVFMLVMARISGMFQLAPVFNSKEIFSLVKLSMSFWIAGLIVFLVPLPVQVPNVPILFILALITELMIGIMIGFAMQLFVIGIEFAGGLMDTQSGMSAASALDPSSGNSTTILSKLTRWTAILIFLIINGHHVVLSAIYQSFILMPVASPLNIQGGTYLLMQLGSQIFAIAVQISAPILIIMFLVDFGFGLLSKIAPQVNVFSLSFQIKPIIAVLIMMIISAGFVGIIQNLLEQITVLVLQLMTAIQV